ncbi:hypothetical protein OG21DRAFT_1526031 [Imleria badia]|nr:hypothetical protein OG21DRAFT_1526031 [Imleria badia]
MAQTGPIRPDRTEEANHVTPGSANYIQRNERKSHYHIAMGMAKETGTDIDMDAGWLGHCQTFKLKRNLWGLWTHGSGMVAQACGVVAVPALTVATSDSMLRCGSKRTAAVTESTLVRGNGEHGQSSRKEQSMASTRRGQTTALDKMVVALVQVAKDDGVGTSGARKRTLSIYGNIGPLWPSPGLTGGRRRWTWGYTCSVSVLLLRQEKEAFHIRYGNSLPRAWSYSAQNGSSEMALGYPEKTEIRISPWNKMSDRAAIQAAIAFDRIHMDAERWRWHHHMHRLRLRPDRGKSREHPLSFILNNTCCVKKKPREGEKKGRSRSS